MKNIVLYFLLPSFVIVYSACSKITENLQRDAVVTDTIFFDIPIISTITTPITVANIATTINLESQINAQVQDLSASNLSSVNLKSINIALDESVGDSIIAKNNFANIESIKINLMDGSRTDSLASIFIPSKAVSRGIALEPVMQPEILKTYISNPAMKYSVTFKPKDTTTRVIKVRMASSYTVTLIK